MVADIDTKDDSTPTEVMEAIDEAMRRYFETDKWLVARNKQFPGSPESKYYFDHNKEPKEKEVIE